MKQFEAVLAVSVFNRVAYSNPERAFFCVYFILPDVVAVFVSPLLVRVVESVTMATEVVASAAGLMASPPAESDEGRFAEPAIGVELILFR